MIVWLQALAGPSAETYTEGKEFQNDEWGWLLGQLVFYCVLYAVFLGFKGAFSAKELAKLSSENVVPALKLIAASAILAVVYASFFAPIVKIRISALSCVFAFNHLYLDWMPTWALFTHNWDSVGGGLLEGAAYLLVIFVLPIRTFGRALCRLSGCRTWQAWVSLLLMCSIPLLVFVVPQVL